MVCDTRVDLSAEQKRRMSQALDRLKAALLGGSVTVVIGGNGALAFKGWNDREGYSDVCAYRALVASNSAELRRAVARAEAMAGRKLDARAVSAGTHSHDGGRTWHGGH